MEKKKPQKHYSDVLREEREKRGNTLEEIAEAVGISIQFLWQIERRERTGTPWIFKIATALDMPHQKAARLHNAAVMERWGVK